MRHLVLVGLLVVTAGSARADKKIVEMTPLYRKEAAGCQVEARGLAKIASGVSALLPTLEDPAEKARVAEDAAAVAAGLAQLEAYCGEVSAMVSFLEAHAKASYRSVEKELDARDNQIRKGRREAKHRTARLAPVTRRLIPLIASKKPAALPPEKRTASAFPSGRTIELPALPGTWRLAGTASLDAADYAEPGATASLAARATTTDCDAQRAALAAKRDIEGLVEAELPPIAKERGAAWRVMYTRRDKATGLQHHEVLCGGAVTVTLVVTPATATTLIEQLRPLLAPMLR